MRAVGPVRFVYFDYKSSFHELLNKGGSFSIYQKNVESIANKIYKCPYSLSPTTLDKVFKVNKIISCGLRKLLIFVISKYFGFATTNYKTF